MEINSQLSTTLINLVSIQTHYSELCMVSRVKFDYCTASRAVDFENRIDTSVVLSKLLKHEFAEVFGEVFDLYKVCRLDLSVLGRGTRRSPWLLLILLRIFLFFLLIGCLFCSCGSGLGRLLFLYLLLLQFFLLQGS